MTKKKKKRTKNTTRKKKKKKSKGKNMKGWCFKRETLLHRLAMFTLCALSKHMGSTLGIQGHSWKGITKKSRNKGEIE